MTTEGVRRQAVVRSASAADHAAVVALLAAADLPVAGVSPELADFYVAEDGGRLVGAAGLEVYGADGLLRSAVVDPASRGSGIGHALVDRILDHARLRDLRAVYLLTTTAERYFTRRGFDRIARGEVPEGVKASLEFREACPASAAVMRKVFAARDGAIPDDRGPRRS